MRGLRRLFILMVVIAGALLGANSAYATDVSGTISQDTTWTSANSPYVLMGNVTVASGVTLTVDPGVIIKSNSYNFGITVTGKVEAIGTSSSPIVFTSAYDSVKHRDGSLVSFYTNGIIR